jgi:hypothetical protein
MAQTLTVGCTAAGAGAAAAAAAARGSALNKCKIEVVGGAGSLTYATLVSAWGSIFLGESSQSTLHVSEQPTIVASADSHPDSGQL